MHNDYVKLGLSLVVPGGGVKKKSPATPQAKPDGVPTTAADEEEDECSGGLCYCSAFGKGKRRKKKGSFLTCHFMDSDHV